MFRAPLFAALLLVSFVIAPLVAACGLRPSATTLTLSPDRTTREGEEVTLSAIVAPVVKEDGAPGGTVEFFDGMASLGSAPLASENGRMVARLAWKGSAGSHMLSARYSGDAAFAESASVPVVRSLTSGEEDLR